MLAEIASPLNSVRSHSTHAAAARRVGDSLQGVSMLRAKQAALAALVDRGAEEEAGMHAELDAFDQRLKACLAARPRLASSSHRSLPWDLGKDAPPPSAAPPAAAAAPPHDGQGGEASGGGGHGRCEGRSSDDGLGEFGACQAAPAILPQRHDAPSATVNR